jgi:hypothetical protein
MKKICGNCYWWESGFGCCCAASPLRSKDASAACEKFFAKADSTSALNGVAQPLISPLVPKSADKRLGSAL